MDLHLIQVTVLNPPSANPLCAHAPRENPELPFSSCGVGWDMVSPRSGVIFMTCLYLFGSAASPCHVLCHYGATVEMTGYESGDLFS